MKEKRNAIIAWLFFGLIAVSVVAAMVYYFSTSPAGEETRTL